VRSDEPGRLTDDERQLLDALLAHEFLGVEALRVQALEAEAKKGCGCGCGTIDLIPRGSGLPRSQAASPVQVEAEVVNAEGEAVGGLLLFLADGMLASLEVYSYGDPIPLPAIDRVRWVFSPR
jgi:hypothetical protein